VVTKSADSTLLVAAEPSQATKIAGLDEVAWVEEFKIPVKHNETAAGVIMGGNAASTRGYDGSTQTVAVADTGIGGGTKTTAHVDVPQDRITAIRDWATTSAAGCYTAKPNGQQLGGTQPLPKWGDWWPADYPAEPLKSDSQAGNDQQMAAFSSRGPTDDGRIKPDVVAPGSWIVSGYSDMYQQQYDAAPNPQNGAFQHDGYGYPVNSKYKYFSGISMSNPLAAGGAAVVRDFYKKKYNVDASA
jgi:subtilisin family serine protease